MFKLHDEFNIPAMTVAGSQRMETTVVVQDIHIDQTVDINPASSVPKSTVSVLTVVCFMYIETFCLFLSDL